MARIPVVLRAVRRALNPAGRRRGTGSRRRGSRARAVAAVTGVLAMTLGAVAVVGMAGVAAADSVIDTIDLLGNGAAAVAVNSTGTYAYVAGPADGVGGAVSIIDLSTNTVTTTIPIGPDPSAVAVNPAGTEVYVAYGGQEYHDIAAYVAVVDLSTDTVTATVPVGNLPNGIAVNPAGTDAYVTNEMNDGLEGTVSVINLTTDTLTATITVGEFPTGVAVNPSGTDAYVTNYDAPMMVISLATNTVTSTIPAGKNANAVALNSAGTDAYVTSAAGGVLGIDLKTDTVIATIPDKAYLTALAVSPSGTDAYATNPNGDTVSVVDLTTKTVIAIIPVGSYPAAMALNPAGTDAYVANEYDGTVSVVALNTPTLPGPPGLPTATDGDHQATISVTSPTIGGIPSFYTVTATDSTDPGGGGQACTFTRPTRACTVSGLINGDSYYFTSTATNTAGTSAASPPSNSVTPAFPADITVALSGPSRGRDGSTIVEHVTLTDNGPSEATAVATTLLIPAGLTVTAAPGAIVTTGILEWLDPSLVPATDVVYPVTFRVAAHFHHDVTIGAVTEDAGYDPNLANNAGVTTIRLIRRAQRPPT
jgi:YVTN family beta-propeller protein